MLVKKTQKLIVSVLTGLCVIGCAPTWQQQGYANESDYQFSQSMGMGNPQQIATLRSYGITTQKQFVELVAEMKSSKYSSDQLTWPEIFSYLSDKSKGQKNGMTAVQYRNQRVAKEKAEKAKKAAAEEKQRKEQASLEEKQRREKAAAEKRERAELAQRYPYTAIISCQAYGQSAATFACFMDGNFKTYLEIKNGDKYGMYSAHELEQAGEFRNIKGSFGLYILLNRNFKINAQNASSDLLLNVKIVQTDSGDVKYEKSVGKFGVVRIGN